MNAATDTIAGIATAPGQGGIAIVRLSGPAALSIADDIFRGPGPRPSHRAANTFVHGEVVAPAPTTSAGDDTARAVDEVVMLVYRAPHSYTCEDVVEFQGHGGTQSVKRILGAVLTAGARAAEPGEFTRRAFLHGRIDLLQAEAVADLIAARTEQAARSALDQLKGSLSNWCTTLYETIMNVAAQIEVSLDFSEHDDMSVVTESQLSDLQRALKGIDAMLATWDEGRLIREGAVVVISGQPNAGKSTLLNALLGTDRAIVTDQPGTTRDTIEEHLVLGGIPLRLVDTAGLRPTECLIEREGMRRAREAMDRADVNLHVIDASRPLDDDERRRLAGLVPARTMLVLNKGDLGCMVRQTDLPPGAPTFHTALCEGVGLAELRASLRDRLTRMIDPEPHAVISERHRGLLLDVRRAVEDAVVQLVEDSEANAVVAAAALREGLQRLGEITGRVYGDALLDSIFARFCIGK